jgi:hypothetical protein
MQRGKPHFVVEPRPDGAELVIKGRDGHMKGRDSSGNDPVTRKG